MTDKIGFFHFGNYWNDPVGSLRCALKGHTPEEVRDSLIVLPEAFNIGQQYYDDSPEKPWNTKSAVQNRLRRICKDFGLSLLGGLIIEKPGDPYPPHSSAYLVTPTDPMPILMCHKECRDTNGVV